MKTLIFLFSFLFFSSYVYSEDMNYGSLKNVKYVKNYDGDTITFNIPDIHPLFGDKISVRVYGIDCPEITGKCVLEKERAKKTKKFTRDFIINAKSIILVDVKRDKYFRILANVNVDGKDLSEELIKNNLAVPYFGEGKKQDWCK